MAERRAAHRRRRPRARRQTDGVGRYLLAVLRVWADDAGSAAPLHGFLAIERTASRDSHSANAFTAHVEPTPKAGTIWEQTRLAQRGRRDDARCVFRGGLHGAAAARRAHSSWRSTTCRSSRTRSGFATREGLRRQWTDQGGRAERAASRDDLRVFRRRDRAVARRRRATDRRGAAGRAHRSPDDEPAGRDRPSCCLSVRSSIGAGIPELLAGVRASGRGRCRRRGSCWSATTARIRRSIPGRWRSSSASAIASTGANTSSDAELDIAYRQARVFVFLSDYEGFAMTPLEALAHGVPSVLLDTPVAREVYGDAARLVPPDPTGDCRGADVAAGRRRGPCGACWREDAPGWPTSPGSRPRRPSARRWRRRPPSDRVRPRHHHRQLQHARGSAGAVSPRCTRTARATSTKSSSSTTRRPTAASDAVRAAWPAVDVVRARAKRRLRRGQQRRDSRDVRRRWCCC